MLSPPYLDALDRVVWPVTRMGREHSAVIAHVIWTGQAPPKPYTGVGAATKRASETQFFMSTDLPWMLV